MRTVFEPEKKRRGGRSGPSHDIFEVLIHFGAWWGCVELLRVWCWRGDNYVSFMHREQYQLLNEKVTECFEKLRRAIMRSE